MLSSAFYIQILIIARISSFAISVESHVYHAVERGSSNTFDYRIYIANLQGIVSPFHDIPLRANDNASVVNMVVEIPRWTNSKMETSRDEKMNPIKQDTKNGKLRFTKNIFPHHGYIWNYGGIPQTWENPNYLEPATETWGDNDPVDALEIGSKVQKTGSVIQVKVLGTMCLIDEGETDWKMIVIDVNDRLADQFNDIDDVERLMPGYLTTMNKWLRTYKIPDGKQENVIAFDGIAQDRMTAMRVINEAHQQWKDLVTDPTVDKHGIACENVSVRDSPYLISPSNASLLLEAQEVLENNGEQPPRV